MQAMNFTYPTMHYVIFLTAFIDAWNSTFYGLALDLDI